MEKRMQQMYEDMLSLYTQLVQTMRWAESEMKKRPLDMPFAVDMGFACKEMDKLLADIGVEVRRRLELAENLVGFAWTMTDDNGPVRTEYCSASIDLKVRPKVPKKDTPEYAQLMEWLGFRDNITVVRLHWPTLCDVITKRIEDGDALPSCIPPDSLHEPKATLRFHKRKEVNA